MRLEQLLVPTDFSTDAAKALEQAVFFAKAFQARVHLLHAFSLPDALSDTWRYPLELIETARREAEERLEDLRKKTAESLPDVTAEVRDGRPAEVILARASELPADMIVMGTRGTTGLDYFVLGSVAERTLRKAECPVLVAGSRAAPPGTSRDGGS
jgi:nucleotide-binding universal stress UspA family protein